jgi:hypothetical protein
MDTLMDNELSEKVQHTRNGNRIFNKIHEVGIDRNWRGRL